MKNKTIKLWKIVLIILAIFLLLFIVDTGRKMYIIKDLQNNVSQYTNEKNYHIKSYEFQGKSINISETYKKDDISLTSVTNLSEDRNVKLTSINKYGNITTYIDAPNEKIVIPNANGVPSELKTADWLYTENIWQWIVRSIKSSIETEECNGKECYKIQVGCFDLFCFDNHKEDMNYFDKETGLLVRKNNGTLEENNEKTNIIVDYHYEFETVTDENLKEPNINEYKIQDNI